MQQLGKFYYLVYFFLYLLEINILFYIRRKLRISIRSVVFLPCFAHQINLCVGEIFKESTEFKVTVDDATKLAVYFHNANNKYFIGQLKEVQLEIYKKYIALIVPGETRWNSIYEMCLSLLKSQQALQVSIFYLVIKLYLKKMLKNLLF